MSRAEGAWIFLSHSEKDWDEVRRVRNLLEEKGHRPLVFFLKCLTDHSELDGLIRREIEARTWFLLCDSDNARRSPWVQAEVAYIKKLQGKYHEQINLNDAIATQIERIDRLCKRVTVFLSHHRDDESFAVRIREALVAHDYHVWSEKEIAPGTLWQEEITNALDQAVQRGFVLVLLSTKSVVSRFVMEDVRHALEKSARAAHGGNVVPIMLDEPGVIQSAMPQPLRRLIGGTQWLDFSGGSFDTNVMRLVADLKSRPMD